MLPFDSNDWREEILRCSDCAYFCLIEDFKSKQKDYKPICKNIDYRKYWVYRPWFCSHCTGEHLPICRQFKPARYKKYICEHFTNADDYIAYQIVRNYMDFHRCKVCFILPDQRQKSFDVYFRDFYYKTYENTDGTLKAICTEYYKRAPKTTIGYELKRDVFQENKELKIENETWLDILQNIQDKVYKNIIKTYHI